MEWQSKSRINGIPEATEVLIELGERSSDVENITRAFNYVVGGREPFLRSIARRVKNNFLMYEVVATGHVGFLSKEIVYEGASIGFDTPYRIITTKPEGEVQITQKTALTCKLIDLE